MPQIDSFSARKMPVYLALAAFVFFSRAWMILVWGSEVPFWDQWDAEAGALYLPWLRGEFEWAGIFDAHNEHRIVLTRLSSLGLFWALGRWSIWAELLLNAGLQAATAVVVARFLSSGLGVRSQSALFGGMVLLFAGTAGWQNALWGFQSQFYFASLLSVTAVGALVKSVPLSRIWWVGWSAALLALFSNGAGIFAAAAALIILVASPSGKQAFGHRWISIGLIIAIVIGGALLRVEPSHHLQLHARTIGDFMRMFSRCLAWPHVNRGWLILIMQLPIVCLMIVRWRRNEVPTSSERCAIAFALLSIFGAAAIAYSRGYGLWVMGPLSRHQDVFLPGTAAQIFALLRLATMGVGARLLAIGWTGVFAVGLLSLVELNLSVQLPRKRALDGIALKMIRTYLATGEASPLSTDVAVLALHPSAAIAVRSVLDEPLLREVLPPTLIQPPLSPPMPRPWLIRHSGFLAATSALVFVSAICAQIILSRRGVRRSSSLP